MVPAASPSLSSRAADAGSADLDTIDFGDLPEPVNALLQRGVAAYRCDRAEAGRLFHQALALGPERLPVYFCLYKIHACQGDVDAALAVALSGLREAARQAGWSADYRDWPSHNLPSGGPGRFALQTLKALAFLHLRRGERDQACRVLDILSRLDQGGGTGWPVVAALAAGLG